MTLSELPQRTRDATGLHLCRVRDCGQRAVFYRGRLSHCQKHHRFRQMQKFAIACGKAAPTDSQLETMLHPHMRCADCNMDGDAGNERMLRDIATISEAALALKLDEEQKP